MKYKESEVVLVKMSGLEVPALVKSVLRDNEYIVQFQSGNEKIVHERLIRQHDEDAPFQFEVQAREAEPKQSTRRSPSRRSPARNSSPTKSPSRRAKAPSPSRKKSPGRKSASAPKRASPEPPSSVAAPFPRRRRPIDELSDSLLNSATELISESSKKADFEAEAKRDFVQEEKQFILHLKAQEQILQDLGKFSDDDEVKVLKKSVERERASEQKVVAPPKEFGGVLGSLVMMFSVPASVMLLHVLCERDSCTFSTLPKLDKYKLAGTYLDLKVAGYYLSYVVLISVLSVVPFVGKRVLSQPSKNKIRVYKMNGLFSAFMIFAIFATIEWSDMSLIDFVYDNYFKFLVASLAFGLLLAVVLHIKSSFVAVSHLNTHAVTYNVIYDFFMGREVNPTIFGLDVKMIIMRSCFIGVLLLNSIFLYKSLNIPFTLEERVPSFHELEFSPTFLIACILQTLYVLDVLVFEAALTTTFELQYEGTGYLAAVGYASGPFLATSVTKYLLESKAEMNVWLLVAVLLLYTAGYIVFRASNAQKNAFRLNPYDPAVANMETIPTNLGKRLLVSGYWGWVRHPNYLGDILMHIAMGAVCWWSPAAFGAFAAIPYLLYRAARVDRRCKRRYGAAWNRYCQRVPYRLIPLVY